MLLLTYLSQPDFLLLYLLLILLIIMMIINDYILDKDFIKISNKIPLLLLFHR
jgi:hypothetical protein